MRFLIGVIVVIISFTVTSCSYYSYEKNMHDREIQDDIIDFNQEVNTEEKAEKIILEWLGNHTNYSTLDNEIVDIEKHQDYFKIQLKRSIIINGRESGVMGYGYYAITDDGELKGIYYSK